jgi:hypothetical protein
MLSERIRRAGKVKPALLLWALGVPLPIVLIVLLFRGCG